MGLNVRVLSGACVLMAAGLPLMHWRTERNFAALSPENQVQPTNKTGDMLTRSCTDTQKPPQTEQAEKQAEQQQQQPCTLD